MLNCPLCRSFAVEQIDQFPVSHLLSITSHEYRTVLKKELRGIKLFYAYQCQQCSLIFFYPFVSGSDEFYASISTEDYYYLKEKPEYEIILPFLPRPLRLLEIGCGPGHFADKLPDGPNSFCGLELNPIAAQRGRERGLFVSEEPIEQFAQAHRGQFNAVGSFQVLEHVPNLFSIIEASLACLTAHGLFFFAVPNQDSFVGYAWDEILNLPPHHLTRWPRRTIEKIVDFFPLDLIEVIEENVADFHLEYYIRTCFEIGRGKHNKQSSHFVSHNQRWTFNIKRRLLFRALAPILANIAFGMRRFRPLAKGHTIMGIYKKRAGG